MIFFPLNLTFFFSKRITNKFDNTGKLISRKSVDLTQKKPKKSKKKKKEKEEEKEKRFQGIRVTLTSVTKKNIVKVVVKFIEPPSQEEKEKEPILSKEFEIEPEGEEIVEANYEVLDGCRNCNVCVSAKIKESEEEAKERNIFFN